MQDVLFKTSAFIVDYAISLHFGNITLDQFQSAISDIYSHSIGHYGLKIKNNRRRPDLNRRITVLQTVALDHLATPPISLAISSYSNIKKTERKIHSDKFSLTLHPKSQYCKKIKGKLYYFGTDKQQALQRYLEQAAYLHSDKITKHNSDACIKE